VRGPIITAAAVYGVLALSGRMLDSCAVELGAPGKAPDVSGWAGWSAIFALLAVIAAAVVALRRRLLSQDQSFIRRIIAGPGLLGASVLIAALSLHFANHARARGAAQAVASAPAPSAVPSAEPVATASAARAAPPPVASAAGSAAPVGQRAPADAVEKAVAAGPDALQALRAQYPKDPDVLEPLVVALARQPEGYAAAMDALDALFTVAPHKAKDRELSQLVVKDALSTGEASTRALDIMAHRMGSLGPDMLYDLMLTAPGLRRTARERLDDPTVKKNFTPELAIAYELREADACTDRVPLLSRAARSGDMRSVAVLMGLGTGTKRGCGARQRSPCPAPCASQASAFKKTAVEIQNRLAQARSH
jgi:hypothetical protein